MPRSQFDVLSALEARRVLWESISAWDDLVAQWRRSRTPFAQLRLRDEVMRA